MIVVTSGHSAFGRIAVRHLLARLPAQQIAVTAPNPAALPDLVALGVDVRPESFADPVAAAHSLAGADAVLIISRPGRFGDGLPADLTNPCVDAAVTAGVGHIVYTSVINVVGTHHLMHHATEQQITSSGVPFTFLRNNLQSEALLPALQLALATKEFVCSFGDSLIASASRADYAEAAAIVLTDEKLRNAAFQLSGPIGLKARGIASVMAEIADADMPVRDVDPANLMTELTSSGASPDVAFQLNEIYNDALMDEWSTASQTLEELLGRPRIGLVKALSNALAEPNTAS
jgi:NAD(P)H dehydrogenase (quinone)